ncbi:MAG: hypothetical protein JSR32_04215 [Proteobacteria bacterium]|nr:hypothetical protein [Pseudomonadota bacterium]
MSGEIKQTLLSNSDQPHRCSPKPNVRLSAKEIEGIRATVDEKGGDLDLLIETEQKLVDRVSTACRLTSQLQMQFGDQKSTSSLLTRRHGNNRSTR